jgi:hypothetical protein
MFIAASGCIEEISFESEFSESQIVVEGSVHNGPGPYMVRIGETKADEDLPEPISGAAIVLISSGGVRIPFIEVDSGTYQNSDEGFTGQPGESYHIEIELADGRSFFSEPERMPVQLVSSTVHLETGSIQVPTASGGTRNEPAVIVTADTNLPESQDPVFLKWSVEGLYAFREFDDPSPFAPPPNTCVVSESISPQNIVLFSGSRPASSQIKGQLLATKKVIFEQFYIRYFFNVITSSITERRYNYWQSVDKIINQSGTIFDVPPANVAGNIKNSDSSGLPPLGYFEAALKDTSREFTLRWDFSFNIPDPCSRSNAERNPNCYNCLQIENSSLERPYYF